MKRNVLIIAGYSPLNRGDAAIIGGMVAAIRRVSPDARVVLHTFSSDAYLYMEEMEIEAHGGLFQPGVLGSRRRRLAWLIPNLWVTLVLGIAGLLGRRAVLAVTPLLSARERAVVRSMATADLIVTAGGGYLSHHFQPLLSFLLMEIWLASRMAPTVLGAQTIGPLRGFFNRLAVGLALSKVSEIQLRDDYSLRVIDGIAPKLLPKCRRVPDFAFGYDEYDDALVGAVEAFGGGRPIVGFSIRSWHFPDTRDPLGASEAYELAMADAIGHQVGQGDRVVLLATNHPSEGSRDDDVEACRAIWRRLGPDQQQHVMVLDQRATVAQIRSVSRILDVFVGTRMHACIFAMSVGVPVLVVAYQPKGRALMEALGRPQDAVSAEHVTGAWVTGGIARLRAERRGAVPQIRPGLIRELAEASTTALGRWLR